VRTSGSVSHSIHWGFGLDKCFPHVKCHWIFSSHQNGLEHHSRSCRAVRTTGHGKADSSHFITASQTWSRSDTVEMKLWHRPCESWPKFLCFGSRDRPKVSPEAPRILQVRTIFFCNEVFSTFFDHRWISLHIPTCRFIAQLPLLEWKVITPVRQMLVLFHSFESSCLNLLLLQGSF